MENNFSHDVELAKNGDKDAFARLYSIVYKDLYNISLYSLRTKEDAQDVVSETIIDAYTGIKSLRDVDAFKPWIFRILSTKIKKKYKDYANSTADIDEFKLPISGLNHEAIELMSEYMKLSEEERMIISLSVIMGYTSDEISEFTGINSNTVRSKLMRAKNKLKEMLTR